MIQVLMTIAMIAVTAAYRPLQDSPSTPSAKQVQPAPKNNSKNKTRTVEPGESELNQLKQQFQTEQMNYFQAINLANQRGAPRPDPSTSPNARLVPKLFELADKHPNSPTGLGALAFIAGAARYDPNSVTFGNMAISLWTAAQLETRIALATLFALVTAYVVLRIFYRLRRWNFDVIDCLMEFLITATAIALATCLYWPSGQAGLALYGLGMTTIVLQAMHLVQKLKAKNNTSAIGENVAQPEGTRRGPKWWAIAANCSLILSVGCWIYSAYLDRAAIRFALPSAREAVVAQQRIMREYLEDKNLGVHLASIDMPNDFRISALWQVHDKNPHRDVQAAALLFIVEKIRVDATSESDSKAIALLDQVQENYAEVNVRGIRASKLAEDMIKDITTYGVGKPAPEIVGKDMDGKEFKLSDYRGKVVMLDFTGEWCTVCRTLYPHSRELASRYKDQPFALLGINSDSIETFRKVAKRENMTWRSWCDLSPSGPIATAWRIQGWPTMHIIDKKGIIRYKNVRNDLETMIDELIQE